MPSILICSYLEDHHVEKIRSVSDKPVHYRPDLLPRPRYQADHVGVRFERSEKQNAEWHALLAGSDILFDFDYNDLDNFKGHTQHVKWIQASSSGIGQLVKRYQLGTLDAILTTAAGVHAIPLAEFTLWAMLAFAKNYPLARRQQRAHVWERFHNDDLEGKTLAVVGLGQIGQAVARKASQNGLRVIGSKRSTEGLAPHELHVEELYRHEDIHTMLVQANYVCLICPLTPETEGLIGETELHSMKNEGVLINIGRGALVQEQPLIAALQGKEIAGAVLDVAPQEPLPSDHPLWDMDNVILFPHSASTSKQENARLTNLFIENYKRFEAGRPLKNVFDPARRY